jgi:hypothetical protein
MNRFRTLVVVAFLLCVQPDANAQYLQAGVSVNDGQLNAPKPVPSGLREGALFSESSFDSFKNSETWIRIPEWLSGCWKTREVISDYADDLEGPVRSNFKTQFGFLTVTDAAGDAWTPIRLPGKTSAESDDFLYRGLVSEEIPLYYSPDKVKIFHKAIAVSVSKQTGIISSTVQQVYTVQYTRAEDGRVCCVTTGRSFDQLGNPLSTGESSNTMMFSLTSKFEATNSDKESLISYLQANKLIPGMKNKAEFSATELEQMAQETDIKFAKNRESLFKRSKQLE